MPEGDTIARSAAVLRDALVGRRVTNATAQPRPGLRSVPRMERVIGATISTVDSKGKHLLIGFDNGLTLRTHLRMSGSWHRYRPGERWWRPAKEATVVIETAEAVAVCFNAPTAELLTATELARHAGLNALGPDLLSSDFEPDVAVARLRARPATEIANALLDQEALAGIGNVYKSEVLFFERTNPWTEVSALDDPRLHAIVVTARRLLRANLRGGARVTTGARSPGEALWVYGRAGRPCRRCGTQIRSARQGELARSTYWCPRCQPA
jgi:endonuclease-8